MTWHIKWHFPESLQFCSYVAEHEGYQFDLAGPAITAQEAEWRTWLTQLLDSTCRQDSEGQTLSRDESHDAQLREFMAYYDAPAFNQLSSLPGLRSRCQRLWPDFRAWWSRTDGEKQRLNRQLHQQLARLNLNRLVRHCMRVANKSTTPDFALTVYLMRWPEHLYRRQSDHCFIADTNLIMRDQVDRLRSLLQTHMIELIGQQST